MTYIPRIIFVVVLILQNTPDLTLCYCCDVVVADVAAYVVAAAADDDDDDDDVVALAFRDIHPSHHVRHCFDSLEYS